MGLYVWAYNSKKLSRFLKGYKLGFAAVSSHFQDFAEWAEATHSASIALT